MSENPRERAEWAVRLGIESDSEAAHAFGDELRRWREGAGLSQEEAARRAGVSGSIWNTWEMGRGLAGARSWGLVVALIGEKEAVRIVRAVERAAKVPGARKPPAKIKSKPEPEPDGWGGWTEEPVAAPTRSKVRGTGTEPVLAAVLASGLGDREKALLCAAVVAMAAGVSVEVEIRARV